MTTTRVRPPRSEVREQIVAAAGEEFAERGYVGTSVAQVAARAGFTKGAVYSNFDGKPELFAAAMQAYFTGAVAGAFDGALGAAATDPVRPPAAAMAHEASALSSRESSQPSGNAGRFGVPARPR